MNDTTEKSMNDGMKNQTSQGATIQAYSNSVNMQAPVSLGQFAKLKDTETKVNNGLDQAKLRANDYLNNIQPTIINNVTNINNYFVLQSTLATTMPKDASKKDWLDGLAAILDQANQYKEVSSNTSKIITKLHDGLIIDSTNFAFVVSEFNSAVSGDQGVLTSLDKDINLLNSQISGYITGITLGSLAIIGGAFITAVGAVADFVTAGASTPLVLLGVGIMLAGGGTVAGMSYALNTALAARQDMYTKQSSLKNEVKVVAAISNGFSTLKDSANSSVMASTQMKNAWDILTSDLSSLSNDLSKGIKDTGFIQKLFLEASKTTVKEVLVDTKNIKQQMSGVTVKNVPDGKTIAQYMKENTLH